MTRYLSKWPPSGWFPCKNAEGISIHSVSQKIENGNILRSFSKAQNNHWLQGNSLKLQWLLGRFGFHH